MDPQTVVSFVVRQNWMPTNFPMKFVHFNFLSSSFFLFRLDLRCGFSDSNVHVHSNVTLLHHSSKLVYGIILSHSVHLWKAITQQIRKQCQNVKMWCLAAIYLSQTPSFGLNHSNPIEFSSKCWILSIVFHQNSKALQMIKISI